MAYFEETLAESAARTTNGTFVGINHYGTAQTLRCVLNVTAVGGATPTLNVVIEDSIDGGATWDSIATFNQVTTTVPNRQIINVTSPFGRMARARWTIGGLNPTYTFSIHVAGEGAS